ncbi:CubicO group peptidase (beta-lactamase class C family) [Nonlabens dokdonensis]|jgi:CubicO group peptidase (beta-lactamase class C family)|uniref:PbpE n=2 Tax=Nonlabens dokdonensis TaxID=328515 RepID=L7W5T6_NONDD|nr:serine hydrolase domain-containing protein [Nonlabens dokdonensis]AGC75166.1 PbpE [Nonlabens dokdonensis DSW-6]PZX39090.1 CubicO group peptidase (beta-lactamase class C family) [Nonlabens dokdonensis]
MKKIFFFTCLLLSINSHSQNEKAQRIDSLFTAMNQNNEFNGVVLFAEDGKVIHKKAYGIADFGTNSPLTTASVFDLASVSKQFTAMGIVILMEQRKLALEDPISKYLPELEFYPIISIENLLTHTSGLPDYMDLMNEHWDHSKIATNKDVIDMMALKKPELLFEPDSEYEYSNTGYLLLASIIEKASGMSYGDFLSKHIFRPLEMNATVVNRPRFAPKEIPNLTKGHVNGTDGNPVVIDSYGTDQVSYFLDGIVGDGMVNSTVDDLYKWDRALYTDQLVSPRSKDKIFTPHVLSNGKLTNYGYGWQLKDHEKYGKTIGHSGAWAGYLTYIERHVDKDKTFIFLQNTSLMTTGNPVLNSRKILYNEPIEIIEFIEKEYTVSELKSYTGIYKNAAIAMDITIAIDGNQLTGQATGQGAFPLDSYEDHKFKFDPAGITIIFSDDKNSFKIKQGGNITLFSK